jgi:leader peptidase (prepilin peptidase)/N-methyltransferase
MHWIALLDQDPILSYGITAVLALAVGSFLNVVIYRLPKILEEDWRRECAALSGEQDDAVRNHPHMTLALPPSHCPHCGHRLRAIENIPVLSYLVLRGRCSACNAHIGLRYPLVEVGTALLSVLVVWRFGMGWESAAALILTWGLIALAVIDMDTRLLPDALTLPLMWLGLLLSLGGWPTDSHSAILGATLGYLFLWVVFHLFRLLTGKEGMGFGDFKLFALFGAWLGWQYLLQILLVSACAGALVGGALILSKGRDRQVPIPFGPYLATAGWIALMWGETINHAYLQWAGLA